MLGVEWLAPYDTNEKMFAARDTVHRLLSAHFATQPTSHWIDLLSANDVWCAPVQSYADLEKDPQIAHKQLFWDVPYADSGKTYRTVGLTLRFLGKPRRRALWRAAQRPAYGRVQRARDMEGLTTQYPGTGVLLDA